MLFCYTDIGTDINMNIIHFDVGDTLIMKKKHPCSSYSFRVLRCGSDVRIICLGCSRDITFERTKLEKMIKKVVKAQNE